MEGNQEVITLVAICMALLHGKPKPDLRCVKLDQQGLLRIDWWVFARGVFCMCAWIFPTEVGSGITVYTSAVQTRKCKDVVFPTSLPRCLK